MVVDTLARIYQRKLIEAKQGTLAELEDSSENFNEVYKRFQEISMFLDFAIMHRILMPIPAKISMYM
jgi:hypothetical protein